MIVSSPWELTALIQQLVANLEETGTPGLANLDMNIKLRQVALLHQMIAVFQAIEHGQIVTREHITEGGD